MLKPFVKNNHRFDFKQDCKYEHPVWLKLTTQLSFWGTSLLTITQRWSAKSFTELNLVWRKARSVRRLLRTELTNNSQPALLASHHATEDFLNWLFKKYFIQPISAIINSLFNKIKTYIVAHSISGHEIMNLEKFISESKCKTITIVIT